MTVTQMEINLSEKIWKVSVETKYGTDVVLLRQDAEPSSDELRSIEAQFARDYDVEAYASVDMGYIKVGDIPSSIEEYLRL